MAAGESGRSGEPPAEPIDARNEPGEWRGATLARLRALIRQDQPGLARRGRIAR